MALTIHGETVSLPLKDQTQVGEVRRAAVHFAGKAGFDANRANDVAIAVTEAATNIVRHANGGEILLTKVTKSDQCFLEILAIDRGKGIYDVGKAMADGVSSGSTPGTGLGAIRRLATEFDIFSTENKGTVVYAKFLKADDEEEAPGKLEMGGVCVPYPGESSCGDGWSVVYAPNRAYVMVVDGLGHGRLACEAAEEARSVFEKQERLNPAQMVEMVHGALRKTRGAAGAFAEFDLGRGEVNFAGVGNISANLLTPTKRQGLTSTNGILGHELRKVQQYIYKYESTQKAIFHSDGITTRWELNDYPGLSRKHPSLIAGVLYRDFMRGKDDATVVVISPRADADGFHA